MDDLRAYLAKPEGQQRYSEGLELFRKYCIKDFAGYYDKLAAGPFGKNPLTLRRCLKDTASLGQRETATDPKPLRISVDNPTPKISPIVKSEKELDLTLELRRLRHKRMQTSQRFHLFPFTEEFDHERALICYQIDRINAELHRVENNLSYLQRYGHLPEEKEQTAQPIPEDIKELRDEIRRCSSLILKVEKRILYLLDQPPTAKGRAKLPEREAKLAQLTVRRQECRLKLKHLLKQQEEDAET